MKVLIKLGGTLLDEADLRSRLAAEIGELAAQHRVVVVHGGGRQMTRFLTERGVESRFVNGLRVTTPDVIDAVLKVFAGSVNHELVSSFVAAGVNAVGLSGIDAALTEAEMLNPELGAVGRVVRTNPELLDTLSTAGFLPVVACVAGGRDGTIYNVNADQMAVACAAGFRADRLFFLTDVAGVKGAEGEVLPNLTISECDRLIATGVATGGMQAKLESAAKALHDGVGEVVIAAGALDNVVTRLARGEKIGTRIEAAIQHA